VIDRGRVIADGTGDELKDRVGGERLDVVLTHPAAAPTASAVLADMAAEPPQADGAVVHVAVHDRDGAIMEAARRLDRAGVGVKDIAVRRPTLDDVFLSLTGHAAQDAADDEIADDDKVEVAA
jgi:ABC-2 type transport system ATP-binding protein